MKFLTIIMFMMEFLHNGIFHNGAFLMTFFYNGNVLQWVFKMFFIIAFICDIFDDSVFLMLILTIRLFTVTFLKCYDAFFTIAFSETNLLHGGDAS